MLQELALGFTLNNEHYVIGFMDGECLPSNPERTINQQHNEMKRTCLERVSDADVLYNIRLSKLND